MTQCKCRERVKNLNRLLKIKRGDGTLSLKKKKKSLSFGVSKAWVIRELRAERIHNEKEKRMKIGKQGKTLSEWKSEWGREIRGEMSLYEGFLCPA